MADGSLPSVASSQSLVDIGLITWRAGVEHRTRFRHPAGERSFSPAARLPVLVRDHHDGATVVVEFVEEFEDFLGRRRVEVPCRFIGEDKLRRVN